MRGEEGTVGEGVRGGGGQLRVLDVDLLEGLDVLGDEGDGHRHHVLDAMPAELADLVVGVWAQPRHGPHLGLVGEGVLVGVAHTAEPFHDEGDRGLDLSLVCVLGRGRG